MPAFSLTPINSFPQTDGTEFPQPLRFSQDDVLFVGPITQVNFVGGTVTEDGDGVLSVTLGGGGASYTAGNNIDLSGPSDTVINAIPTTGLGLKALQFDNSGVFGATLGTVSGNLYALAWSPQTSMTTQPSLLLTSTLTIPVIGNVAYSADYKSVFAAWADDGTQEGTQMRATIGSNSGAWTAYLPETFTLPRAAAWISGPETHGGSPSYDAWLISNGILFQSRSATVDPPNFDYTLLEPLVLLGGPTTPTAFDNAFQVKINGSLYWIPCVAQ